MKKKYINSEILVILIAYNSAKWIYRNLDSLFNQDKKINILLIDNKSSDNTVSIVEDSFPQVEIIKLNENIGFAAANNIGFLYAVSKGYKYVFLVNHDAWLAPNCLNQLIKCSDKDNLDILSPMHLNGTGTDWDYGFKRFMPNLPSPVNFITNQKTFEVEKINGAFMLITTRALKALKGFDPLFYFYGEDDDFCARARMRGFKIAVVSDAIAFHDREYREPSAKRHFYLTLSSYFLQIKLMKNNWFSAFLKTLLGITLNISKNIFKLNFKVIMIEFKILYHLIFSFSKIKSSSLHYSLKS
jgi:GT2 family glycosyltransferase